jgi:hypothetical protein
MTRTIRQGYVAIPKTPGELMARKYPFRLLKEGDYLDPPWPLADLHRVRAAVRYWNKRHNGRLYANVHPDGLGEHGPCVQVGWPKGAKAGPAIKRRGAKRQ